MNTRILSERDKAYYYNLRRMYLYAQDAQHDLVMRVLATEWGIASYTIAKSRTVSYLSA